MTPFARCAAALCPRTHRLRTCSYVPSDCSHFRLLPVLRIFSSAGSRRSAWRRRRGSGRRHSRYGVRADPSEPRAEPVDCASESFFVLRSGVSWTCVFRICMCKCAYVCRACPCESGNGSEPVGWSHGLMWAALGHSEASRSVFLASDVRNSVTLTMCNQLVGSTKNTREIESRVYN